MSSSILKNIKHNVKNSGSNKGKIMYFKDGSKERVRFLQDVEDGLEFTFHDKFDEGLNHVCQKHFDKECPSCEREDVRTRQMYAWCVWDWENKDVKLIMGAANNFSPIPALVSMYESYETLLDRDYVIKQDGKQMNKSFTVVPMDKAKFKNSKAKPLTHDKMMETLNKAFPADDGIESNSNDNDNDDENDDDNEDENEYSDMSPKELYKECIERGLTVPKKKKKSFYIDKLEEDDDKADDEDDDWEDDEDEDDEEW